MHVGCKETDDRFFAMECGEAADANFGGRFIADPAFLRDVGAIREEIGQNFQAGDDIADFSGGKGTQRLQHAIDTNSQIQARRGWTQVDITSAELLRRFE